jgi:hypothetical protein
MDYPTFSQQQINASAKATSGEAFPLLSTSQNVKFNENYHCQDSSQMKIDSQASYSLPPLSNTGVNYTSPHEQIISNSCFYSICVDWLQISYLTHILPEEWEQDEVFELSRTCAIMWKSAGNKFFKNLFEVFWHGEKIGYLLSHPRSCVMKEGLIQLKIENHILYTEELSDIVEFFSNKFTFNNISRMDLAIDTTSEIRQWIHKKVIRDEAYELKGKALLSGFKYDSGTKMFESYYIGSKSSDKQLVVYDKTKELEHSNKAYIREFWLKNGLLMTEGTTIDRVEIRLQGKAIKKLALDIEKMLLRLKDSEFMASLMKTQLNNFFQFVETSEKSSDTNRARRDVTELIDWNIVGGQLLPKCSTNPANEVWNAKLTVKNLWHQLMWNPANTQVQESCEMVINQMVDYYDLREWYEIKTDYWLRNLGLSPDQKRTRLEQHEQEQYDHAF